MHIMPDDIGTDLYEVIEAFQNRSGSSFDPVLERLEPRSRQIYFHETYHFWQGLRLPFLHRYAMTAFSQMISAFIQLSLEDSDFHRWSCLLPEMMRLDLDEMIGFAPQGKIFWGGSDVIFPNETVDQIRLTPIDLLECAASLAEFQWSTSEDHLCDPFVLRRWAKRNPNYLHPFNFAARYLGSESLALRTLLPLINAAFHTTMPVRAFGELLARLRMTFMEESEISKAFFKQPEPCRWHEVFQVWLDDLKYEADSDASAQILGGKYFRLTLETWALGGFVDKENKLVTHPLLGPAARQWFELGDKFPMATWLIDQPGWVPKYVMNKFLSEFSPPISAFRFHLGSGHDRVFMIGDGDFSGFTEMKDPEDPQLKGTIADFQAAYGAVRRASGAHFDESQRFCYHSSCPEFEMNFCNAYTSIPDSFKKCGFTQRTQRMINHWREKYADDKNRSR